jgi:hypothetical protein
MSLLEFLSEVNIKEWLRRKDKPDYKPPPPVEKTALGKPVEEHLFDEIKRLLDRAHKEPDEILKKELLAEVTNLEIRLALSYETQGYGFLAKNTQEAIQKYKNSLSAKER